DGSDVDDSDSDYDLHFAEVVPAVAEGDVPPPAVIPLLPPGMFPDEFGQFHGPLDDDVPAPAEVNGMPR
ncbi:hypothetical protein A2U01_0102580, partial [Trifolium medium]|nr:hypothetical protein [Trifolium medium]